MLDNGMVEKRLPDGRCVDSHALALELVNAFRIAGMINRIPQWQGKFSKYFYALLWSLPDDVSRLAVVDVFAQLPHGALPGEADKFFREFTKYEPFKNIYQFFETHFLGPESKEKLLPANSNELPATSEQRYECRQTEWFYDEKQKIAWNSEVLRLRECPRVDVDVQRQHGWKPNEWFFDEQKKIRWNDEVLRLREYTQRVGVANALQALAKMQKATESDPYEEQLNQLTEQLNQLHFGPFGIFHKSIKEFSQIPHQLLGKRKANKD